MKCVRDMVISSEFLNISSYTILILCLNSFKISWDEACTQFTELLRANVLSVRNTVFLLISC